MSVQNVAYGQIWAEHYGKIVMIHMFGVGVASAISPFHEMTMGTIASIVREQNSLRGRLPFPLHSQQRSRQR